MLIEATRTSALEYFAKIPDPRRRKRSCMYPLGELMFMALCGILSGADGWVSGSCQAICRKKLFNQAANLSGADSLFSGVSGLR
jgi:hypothetical protein